MKILLIIIICIFLTGCNKDIESKEKQVYNSYIEKLSSDIKNNDNLPFDIEVYIDRITDYEVMYRIIIDNPKEELKDIETLVIHNKNTDDVFPSSGIFDTKYSLIPNIVNKESFSLRKTRINIWILFEYLKALKILKTLNVLINRKIFNNRQPLFIKDNDGNIEIKSIIAIGVNG